MDALQLRVFLCHLTEDTAVIGQSRGDAYILPAEQWVGWGAFDADRLIHEYARERHFFNAKVAVVRGCVGPTRVDAGLVEKSCIDVFSSFYRDRRLSAEHRNSNAQQYHDDAAGSPPFNHGTVQEIPQASMR